MANRPNFRNLQGLWHSTYTSPSENDAPDELQQPTTPSRVNPHAEAKSHPKTLSSSRSDEFITGLSSLFRSQPPTSEEIKLMQRPSHPLVVEVAAVRGKQTLVVARGPKFMKAFRAHLQQSQSHAKAQASSSHTQPVDASTSATPPAPGTEAAQSPPVRCVAAFGRLLYLRFP
ncbi:hypothetical protein EDD22DRAFT_1052536 [Suillus occidentalis]|nr:hypothetical protein EDD22DRAFT_1052536 [Suillus occidentalis]